MPTLRTNLQNKLLHTLLTKLHIDLDTKEDLVLEYTDHRTTRSSEMHQNECQQLINALLIRTTPTAAEQIRDQKRKRVISHLAQAGYTLPTGKPDMAAITQWVEKQKFKKKFNAHTSDELSKLIYASRQVLNHQLQKS